MTTHGFANRYGIWKFPAYSLARRQVIEHAQKLALCHCPVLVTGPTGAGKSTLAEDITNNSPWSRSTQVINCANQNPEHLALELFGALKGRFSGVPDDVKGALALSTDGTLRLEEIGDLPLSHQAMLLLLLDRAAYKPVGGGPEQTWNGRIVATTNCDLRAMVKGGTFREDLYFRISQNTIDVPPLEKDEVRELILDLLVKESSRLRYGCELIEAERRELAERLLRIHLPAGIRQVSKFANTYLSHKEAQARLDERAFERAMSELRKDLDMYGPAKSGPSRPPPRAEGLPPSLDPAERYPSDLGDLIVLWMFLRDAEALTSLDSLAARYGIGAEGAGRRLGKVGLHRRDLGNVEVLRAARDRLTLPSGIVEALQHALA